MSLLLIPKNVVINHIIPFLTYKERTKLYCTCKHFWCMKTNEYIFGEWVGDDDQFAYDLVYTIDKQEIGFLPYEYMNDEWRHWSLSNSSGGNFKYFCKHRKSIKRKLKSYWDRFGAIKRIKQ